SSDVCSSDLERVDDVPEPVEGRAHDHLELEQPADGQEAGGAHSATSATYASSRVGSRRETRPTSEPFRWPRIACVSSTPGSVCTTSTCACSRSSTATAT